MEYELTPQDIADADVVILAIDVRISGEERFKGKPLVRTGTATVIKNPLDFLTKVENALKKKQS